MNKVYLFIVLILTAFLNSGNAQEVSEMKFSDTSHYFGVFSRNQGVKTHTFKFENVGTEPILITRVKATCGCTATEWTRSPVLPGKTGEVKVQFNPKKFSGYFSKKVSVYTNQSAKAVDLYISGRIQVNNKISDEFDYFIGDLKADKEYVDFGVVEVGSKPLTKEIRLINIMRDTVWLKMGNSPKQLAVEQSRTEIAPGGNCKLTFHFDPTTANEWGSLDTLIKLTIRRSVKTEVRKLPIKLTVIDRFSGMDKKQLSSAPAISFPMADKVLLEAERPGQWKSVKLELTNTGASELLIRKLELESENIQIKKYDEVVAPGKSGKIVLAYRQPGEEELVDEQLIVWSNSPENYRLNIPIRIKREYKN
ncbi:DUF1573 domain-containing protein [Sunxiuqinia elliptica]